MREERGRLNGSAVVIETPAPVVVPILVVITIAIVVAVVFLMILVISVMRVVVSGPVVIIMPAMLVGTIGPIMMRPVVIWPVVMGPVMMRFVVMRHVGLVRTLLLRLGPSLRRILPLRNWCNRRRRWFSVFSFRRGRRHIAAADHADAA